MNPMEVTFVHLDEQATSRFSPGYYEGNVRPACSTSGEGQQLLFRTETSPLLYRRRNPQC